MSIEPIENVPEFVSNVPEPARRKINEDIRWMADTLSISQQEHRWFMENYIRTHNEVVQNSVTIKKWKTYVESPVLYVAGLVAAGLSAAAGALFQKLWKGE